MNSREVRGVHWVGVPEQSPFCLHQVPYVSKSDDNTDIDDQGEMTGLRKYWI